MNPKKALNTPENLAEFMHEAYEDYAIYYGWKTQKSTQVSWDKLPKENKDVMLRVARDILLWIPKTPAEWGGK